MADKNTNKLQKSASLTIGGKKYNSSFIAQSSTNTKTTGTIQTPSMKAEIAKDSVENHTEYYTSNNAKTSSDKGLEHAHNSKPQSTQRIKTSENNITTTSNSTLNTREETNTDNKRSSSVNVVAGKVSDKGVSMGTAYYTTLAAGKHNAMSLNIDTSNIKTSSMIEKASIARAEQAALRGSYSASQILKSTSLEAKSSFYEAIASYSKNGVMISQSIKNGFGSFGATAIGKAQGALGNQDDMGNQLVGGAIGATIAGYTTFKAAQTISPLAINTIKDVPNNVGKIVSVGKGVWDISSTAGKATLTLVKTANSIKSGFIPFTASFTKAELLHQAKITGLLHTITSQRIIRGVNTIKTATTDTISMIKTGVSTTTNTIKNSVTLIRGMVNGSVKTSTVAHNALKNIGKVGVKSFKAGTKLAVRGAVKGSIWTYKRGLPNTMKGISTSALSIGGILSNSEDMMVSGTGNALILSTYGLKTSVVARKATGHVIKTSVKGGIGTAKNAYNAAKFIKQKGLRKAWMKARNKVASAIAKAGKSAVLALLNLVKSIGSKVIVPIIIIVVAVSAFMGVLSAPTVAIGGVFSSLFDKKNDDGTYTETDIRAFLTNTDFGIPALRTGYINDLYSEIQSNLKENGGSYHFVRFKTNTQADVIEPTIEGISGVFFTEDDLCNIIQPIFNAIILQKYELAPTEAQAKTELNEIFNKLFRKDYEATVEHCGQSHTDGSGTPNVHSCGSIHALDDCPNKLTGTHDSFTCSSCCYHYCEGHEDDEGDIHYCSGCKFACNGYTNCGGHDVLTITLNMDGLYQLLYEYFEQPIDNLSNITERTEEEEKELSSLKDAYEICLEYITNVARQYGGGLTMDDLSGVQFINGSRNGNQAVVDLALSQIGQVGGQPYWSWYGFSSRVEWCACFVSWCMNNNGHSEVRFSSCNYGGVPYFKNNGRWANGGYTDLVAGDVIFFDWNGDGKAQHTGIVIGTDGTKVYTVEGNSGDACRLKEYSINSGVILGYGLMNY